MENNNMYDWVFWFNSYTHTWSAAKRENYNDLFSNNDSENVLKSSRIDTLIELISKTNGDKELLNKMVYGGRQRTKA